MVAVLQPRSGAKLVLVSEQKMEEDAEELVVFSEEELDGRMVVVVKQALDAQPVEVCEVLEDVKV